VICGWIATDHGVVFSPRSNSMKRRQLDFRSGQEVIDEIERLRRTGYVRAGTWNLSQICEHLDKTMRLGLSGGDFRMPRVVQATLGKWFFRRSLKKRKMMSGLPSHRSLMPEADEIVENEPTIDACIGTIREVEAFAGPVENYPLVSQVNVNEWRDLMWIHASHHLSFLLPNAESPADTTA
jgi:hypothetical protein